MNISSHSSLPSTILPFFPLLTRLTFILQALFLSTNCDIYYTEFKYEHQLSNFKTLQNEMFFWNIHHWTFHLLNLESENEKYKLSQCGALNSQNLHVCYGKEQKAMWKYIPHYGYVKLSPNLYKAFLFQSWHNFRHSVLIL